MIDAKLETAVVALLMNYDRLTCRRLCGL